MSIDVRGNVNPFCHRRSLRYQVFKQAMLGTTIKKITKYVESFGGDAPRILRLLRQENYNGTTWKYVEKNGTVTVEVIKQAAGSRSSGKKRRKKTR